MTVAGSYSTLEISATDQNDSSLSDVGRELRNSVSRALNIEDATVSTGKTLVEAVRRLARAVERANADYSHEPNRFEPLQPETLRIALSLLHTLVVAGMQIPEISVDPDGHVGFDWEPAEGVVITVSVSPTGTLSYAARAGKKRIKNRVTYQGVLPTALAMILPERDASGNN